MPDPHLYDLASDLLTTIEQIFTDAGVTLPDRRFVSDGDVAFDCDLLAVQVSRVFAGLPGQQQGTRILVGPTPRTAEIKVWLIRCAPTLKDLKQPPTVAQIDASAQVVLVDGWTLLSGLLSKHADKELLPACDDLVVSEMTNEGPEGAMTGWQLTIEVQL